VGFEPTIPASERAKTILAADLVATSIRQLNEQFTATPRAQAGQFWLWGGGDFAWLRMAEDAGRLMDAVLGSEETVAGSKFRVSRKAGSEI
jgi:hypothetical protein